MIIKGKQQLMHFPEPIYLWMVNHGIISNQGQIDKHGQVHVTSHQSAHFINGFLVAELIKTIVSRDSTKVPPSLITIKSDNSKSTKLTNWNFIWLALVDVGLNLQPRLKELILQGEKAIIVEVVKQLHDHDQSQFQSSAITIKSKPSAKVKGFSLDVKKVNFSKTPEESESSLEFLILLLKSSLGMKLQEILGLFTNQNKYLAHLIVKGLSQNFQPVILFYALLNKHIQKLQYFLKVNTTDAEACLLAIKPGFTSRNTRVVELAIELFGKLEGIYEWFVSAESKCVTTFFLGFRRHKEYRKDFWVLLMKIIERRSLDFFTQSYPNSFENMLQLTQISTILISHIASSQELKQELTKVGVVLSWIETAVTLPRQSIDAQISAFNFVGEVMMYLPETVEEDCYTVMSRDWLDRSFPDFIILSGELINILTKLASRKSVIARRLYAVLCKIVEAVGRGDKRDFLVQNFMPMVSLFPTMPSEYFIMHLKGEVLTPSELLLVCQSIENHQNIQTLIEIGIFLKQYFIENPVLNGFIGPLLKEIVEKTVSKQEGLNYFGTLAEESLYGYAVTFLKYKPKHKQNNQGYFGKGGNPDPVNKDEQMDLKIGQHWKDNYLNLTHQLIKIAEGQGEEAKEVVKAKLIKVNNYIKFHNSKLSSKDLAAILLNKFKVKVDEKPEQSQVNKEKEKNRTSEVDFIEKINAVTTEERRLKQDMEAAAKEKKYLDFKKRKVIREIQNSNLMRGQVNQGQIHEDGFLQLVVHQPKETTLLTYDELQKRQIEAIECVMKRYRKVLRHLFLTYTSTRYVSHNIPQVMDDIQKRKEILTVTELIQLLKDYGKFFLTYHGEVVNMVRDINVKILKRRAISQLDFQGFQFYILQFCSHNMLIPHQTKTRAGQNIEKRLKDQPIEVVLKDFFHELKATFIAKGERIDIFDDIEDIPHTRDQAVEVERLTDALEENPQFIMPAGFKKMPECVMEYNHAVSQEVGFIPIAYEAALEAVDYILSREPLQLHAIQGIAKQKTKYKVKATGFISPEKPRERAMSTLIPRNKSPLLHPHEVREAKKSQISPAIQSAIKDVRFKDRPIAKDAAVSLEQILQKVEDSFKEPKQNVIIEDKSEKSEVERPKRRAQSQTIKMEEVEQRRRKAEAKKKEERDVVRKKEFKEKKQEEKKRREHVAKFLEEQKQKMLEKKQKEEQQKLRKAQEEQDKLNQKKANLQKFKSFHHGQVQKIKKIEDEAQQKKKVKEQVQIRNKEKDFQLHQKLKQKIEISDKKRMEARKEVQQSLSDLLHSAEMKQIFKSYEANLRGVYNFLIAHTYNSLTDKKHNNQIIYDTWRYFLHEFEVSPIIVDPKQVVLVFKNLTKHKVVEKEYFVGLTFNEFQEALLHLAAKYKGVFNVIGDRVFHSTLGEGQEGGESKQKSKEFMENDYNQFQADEVRMEDVVRENNEGKNQLNQYGDLTKVTGKTLKGLIHYLKVPKSKAGQEKRFREILTQKLPNYAHLSQRLKQKLSEDFSLLQPKSPKKTKLKDSKVSNQQAPEPIEQGQGQKAQ